METDALREITTDRHIGFLASICDTTVNFAMDNGMSFTYIDSAFFFSHFDTSMFKLRDFFPPISRYRYEGEITIKINDSVFKINSFIVRPFEAMGAEDFQVIVGYDVLRNCALKLDLVNNRFELNNNYSDSGYTVLNLISEQEQFRSGGSTENKYLNAKIYVNSKIKEGKFLLDLGTGGRKAVAVFKERFFRYFEKEVPPIDSTISKGAGYLPTKAYIWHIDSINTSGISFANIKIGTVMDQDDTFFDKGKDDGYIGWQFFKDCIIIIDWQKNVLLIKQKNTNAIF
jgi:hypothetical protein